MDEIERVRSVSADVWLVSGDRLGFVLSERRPIQRGEFYRGVGYTNYVCLQAVKRFFGCVPDPDAPPRRVRVTIELIDE